jgi:hypothetical protein
MFHPCAPPKANGHRRCRAVPGGWATSYVCGRPGGAIRGETPDWAVCPVEVRADMCLIEGKYVSRMHDGRIDRYSAISTSSHVRHAWRSKRSNTRRPRPRPERRLACAAEPAREGNYKSTGWTLLARPASLCVRRYVNPCLPHISTARRRYAFREHSYVSCLKAPKMISRHFSRSQSSGHARCTNVPYAVSEASNMRDTYSCTCNTFAAFIFFMSA